MIFGFTSQHAMWGPWLLVIFLCFTCAIYDLAERRIPNYLTLSAWGCGLVYVVIHAGPWGLLTGLAASFAAAIPYLILFLFAGGGAGDVKLMAAIGAWLGFPDTLVVLVGVSIAAVVFGIIWSIAQRRLGAVVHNLKIIGMSVAMCSLRMTSRRDANLLIPESDSMTPMPYAVAICAGVWASAAGVWLWAH